jgi:hypothetical protein
MVMDKLEEKGIIIAAMVRLTGKNGSWLVPSQSSEKAYTVDPVGKTCTCPDHLDLRAMMPPLSQGLILRRRGIVPIAAGFGFGNLAPRQFCAGALLLDD